MDPKCSVLFCSRCVLRCLAGEGSLLATIVSPVAELFPDPTCIMGTAALLGHLDLRESQLRAGLCGREETVVPLGDFGDPRVLAGTG